MKPQNSVPNRYGYLRSKRRLWGGFGFLLGIFLVFCLHPDTRWIVNRHISSLSPLHYSLKSATYARDVKAFPQKGLAEKVTALWLMYPDDENGQYAVAKSILGNGQGEREGTIYLRWLLSFLNQSDGEPVGPNSHFATMFLKEKIAEGLKVSEEYALRFPKNPYFRLVKMELLAFNGSRSKVERRDRILKELDALSRADFSDYRDYSLADPAIMTDFLEKREGRLTTGQKLSILERYNETQKSSIESVLALLTGDNEKVRERINAQLVEIGHKMIYHLVSPLQEREAREIFTFAMAPRQTMMTMYPATSLPPYETRYNPPYPIVNGMIGWFVENFALRLILLVALCGGLAGLKVYRNRFTLEANNPPKEKQALLKVLFASAVVLLTVWCMAESLVGVSLAQVSPFDPIFTQEYAGQALWMSIGFVAAPLALWLFVLLAFTMASERFTLNALAKRVSRTALPLICTLLVCYLGASFYTARLELAGQSYVQARYAMANTEGYTDTFYNFNAPLEYLKNKLRSMTY